MAAPPQLGSRIAGPHVSNPARPRRLRWKRARAWPHCLSPGEWTGASPHPARRLCTAAAARQTWGHALVALEVAQLVRRPSVAGRPHHSTPREDPDPLAAYCGVASRLQTAAAQAAPPQAPPVHAPMSAERLQQYIDDAQDAARRLSTLRATSSAAKHVPFSSAAGAALLGSIREVPQYASPAGGAQPRFTPSLGPGSCGYATNRTTVENDLRTIGTATRPETRPGSLATAATGFPASTHAQAIQTPQPARPSGAQPEAAASVGGASGGDHAVNQCPIRSAVDARLAERRGRHSH